MRALIPLTLVILAAEAGAQAAVKSPKPVPVRVVAGPGVTFDFPAIEIGIAEYPDGPTGATVFYFPKGVSAAVDVRGGAAGTIGTDFLRLSYPSQFVDAITFSGGSSYGLSVATGVAEAIKRERNLAGDWGNIATVAGAIVFDLGGRRFNTITPDGELGDTAFRARKTGWFPNGNYGAGRFTTQGGFFGDSLRQHSGQGGAFREIGHTKIAVFTIVNALGAVVDRNGQIARCGSQSVRGCGPISRKIAERLRYLESRPVAHANSTGVPSTNTTLTLLVTNQKLPFWALQRLAVQVHTSMARAIHPYSTENDGDVLFAVSTQEVENNRISEPELGLIASEVAWDAVLASIPRLLHPAQPGAAQPAKGRISDEFNGEYELSARVSVTVAHRGDTLVMTAPQGMGIYIPKGETRVLSSTAADEFVLGTSRGEIIRFDRQNGKITGFTMNALSGTHRGWPVVGKKVR